MIQTPGTSEKILWKETTKVRQKVRSFLVPQTLYLEVELVNHSDELINKGNTTPSK